MIPLAPHPLQNVPSERGLEHGQRGHGARRPRLPGGRRQPHRERAATPLSFRADVEGLRAVAILLVVLYHCNTGLSGGYVGVDVFFVISGFLITSQLVRELRHTGTISFRGFYARRIRRILPAAALTTVVTVVASGMLLSPLAANRVFDDARAAAVFGANIHFAATDADYFNGDLSPSPMRHYWSLSVEEQFYFVWPLLLFVSSLAWFGLRRRRGTASGRVGVRQRHAPRLRVVIVVLGVLAALSYAGSILQTGTAPEWAYYAIFTRAWELAAGALVALSLPMTERLDRRLASVLTWIGVGCIAAAAVSFDNATPFPGSAALVPVAGAALIIAAGSAARTRWAAEAVLGTPPFQRVGGWSYSWYLWHWPVLILAPAVLGHALSEPEALAMAALSLLIAIVSFVLVERPIRRMRIVVRRPSVGLAGGAFLVAASLAAVALAGPVFTSLKAGPAVAAPTVHGKLTARQLAADLRAGLGTKRVPANLVPRLSRAAKDKALIDSNGCLLADNAVRSRGCIFGDRKSRTSIVLFGDSHAAAWFPAVSSVASRNHWRLVVLVKPGCPAAAVNVVRHGRVFRECPVWRRDAERQIAALHPALVVVASADYPGAQRLAGVPTGSGGTWQDGTQATFRLLARSARNVAYIRDVPRFPVPVPDCVSGHASNVRACTIARHKAVYAPQLEAADVRLAAADHVHAIDPMPWFCTPQRCPVIVGYILLYRDAQHMVPEWSRFIAPVLADVLVPLVRQTA